MGQYNVAIIGLGIMGRRMITNFAKHPSFKIASVWDPSKKSIEKTKADFPDIHFSDTPEALINEVQPDLLYIACPPEFHKHYALKAIDLKIPLYIEKPLGVDIQESESLVEILEIKNHINAVNFVQASSEAIEKVQLLLENNELGDITGVDIYFAIPSMAESMASGSRLAPVQGLWRLHSRSFVAFYLCYRKIIRGSKSKFRTAHLPR